MTTGPTDARSLQMRVSDEIRARIESGEYAPGQQLPTFDQLADTYKCSLAVIRGAAELLRQQGLVVTRRGLGTFVREHPQARRHGLSRYAKSRWRYGKPILQAEAELQGLQADQELRELGEVPAPPFVATRLGIEVGTPVWVRRRTTTIDQRPNQLADSYYELEVVDGTLIKQVDTGPGGGFARLEDAGYELDQIREEWLVRMPTTPETLALRLPSGTPVVDLIRTTYDTTGRVVEVMAAVIAGDMVTFDYQFPIPD